MNYQPFVENILNNFSKEEKKIFESIKSFDKLDLASNGINDIEGYQIFTPKFIVEQMTSSVIDGVLDFSKNILEPTSGDGAFTTYILQQRLKSITNDFEIEALKALSTIYSIEMDCELIAKQRNNIYFLMKQFIELKTNEVDESYYEMVKCIITKNFMWAMFDTDGSFGGFFGIDVAYMMPNAVKKKKRNEGAQFPVWNISNLDISFEMEGVEANE